MIGSLLDHSISLSDVIHWLVAVGIVITVVRVAVGGHDKLAAVLTVFGIVAIVLGVRAARARADAEHLISPHSKF